MTDLFPHYPSPPEELVGIAAQLISTAADTEATLSDVRGGVGRAVDAVDGDLTFPMSTAPEPVIHTGANLTLTARFASGAVMFFAQAVHTYNQGIDRLNAQVHEGELDAMSAGKAAKLQRLTAEQAQLEADLDAAAARVATMLRRGPMPRTCGSSATTASSSRSTCSTPRSCGPRWPACPRAMTPRRSGDGGTRCR